ncbi:hypothetical protein ASPBRDRAFT_51433 [Aspergillus brasiliensis CBS 101740]|uniref:Uncharacterized protein n=1 Tax=Aspergillus brasiliensis (strain CBS 101740 / IMI 381727 / IBT 21946) TaxID=767769 RepID=A0A1L9UVH7_ASPBC|nr:hypothetical protein ASPBRDRAFT_51433 [Aspergillus brasiliensis CBS 101740]
MATNTMLSTSPSMVTRPRSPRPSGSALTWSDVIRSNRSPSSVIRRLRNHLSASTATRCDSTLSLTRLITRHDTLNPPHTLVRRGAIRRSVPRSITAAPTYPSTGTIYRSDSFSTSRTHDSASNYDVSKPSQSDASILPDTPSTNSTATTPSSDISFFSDIYSTSSSDTCSSNTSFSDISESPHSSDASTECNCGSILFDALDSGLGGLERIIDPVEQLSLCKTCPKEEALREFLYMVCKGILRQYRHLYYALEEHYETVVYRRSCSSYEREQHDYTFMLYAAQIERIIASVDRINRVLPEQPVYDGDTWYALANQGDQLADATGRLREQVVFSHG